jgi:uncharacterized SAM-binding protein YcdF (DUF218 family)
MLFVLSKFVQFLFLPSNLIGLLGLAGLLACVGGRRRFGQSCLVISALLLAVCGWTPLGPAALMILEDRFPDPRVAGPVAGIVMLGGAVDTHITHDRDSIALNEAGERLAVTAELSRRFPDARIVLSGGSGHAAADGALSESRVAHRLLVALGVGEQRIAMEERSRTTCENATETVTAMAPRPDDVWLLVTSASHMPRAVACFRAAELKVVPYPVDYRTRGFAELRRPVASIAMGLAASDLAAHEWLGLVTYRLFGLTRDLLPAP